MSWMTQGERPASVEDFLVITFSTAAAAELRGRISEELERRRAEEPGSKRLRREAALVRRAPIETIHGFARRSCGSTPRARGWTRTLR